MFVIIHTRFKQREINKKYVIEIYYEKYLAYVSYEIVVLQVYESAV